MSMMHGKDMLKILEDDLNSRTMIAYLMESMNFDARTAILRPEPIFYDYPSMLIPEKRKPLVNADQLIGWDR